MLERFREAKERLRFREAKGRPPSRPPGTQNPRNCRIFVDLWVFSATRACRRHPEGHSSHGTKFQPEWWLPEPVRARFLCLPADFWPVARPQLC